MASSELEKSKKENVALAETVKPVVVRAEVSADHFPPPLMDDDEQVLESWAEVPLSLGSSEGEAVQLRDFLSDEAEPFEDEITDDSILVGPVPQDVPSIPGMGAEVTKPIRPRTQELRSDDLGLHSSDRHGSDRHGSDRHGSDRHGSELLSSEARKKSTTSTIGTPHYYDENHGTRARPSTLPPYELVEMGADHESEHDETGDLTVPGILRTREARLEMHVSDEDSLTVEGPPLSDTDMAPSPPNVGDKMHADDGREILLGEALGEQGGDLFFRATIVGEAEAFTAVWSAGAHAEPPWARLPDHRLVRPHSCATTGNARLRLFPRPRGNTLVDYLTNKGKNLPALAVIDLGIELCEILEGLHGANQYILDLDPSQIVVEQGGRVRFYGVGGFWSSGEIPHSAVGVFAAPEVQRRHRFLVGAHSDVYCIGLLMYALLARHAPLTLDLDPSLLVSPRVFRPECPVGIWSSLSQALHRLPARRLPHARAFRFALIGVRDRLRAEAVAADRRRAMHLSAWAEVHCGLGKAQRGGEQQDRAVALTHRSGRVGLFVVSDGVSRSRYGSGAFASEQVADLARRKWESLSTSGLDALMVPHVQRVNILQEVTDGAAKRIAHEVNAHHGPVPNEPNQVMSTTTVAAYIVDGEATVANLGDSRAYLVRDNTIDRVTIDHDRATDALRMGLFFDEAVDVSMGAALTRVVGRVHIDPDGVAHPDPFAPEIFRVQLLPGDRLLLCSDGLTDYAAGIGATQSVAEAAILETLRSFADPVRAAYELVVLANRGGGHDNISCVVINVHPG